MTPDRRIALGIQMITESIGQQSDNITFLLQEQAQIKGHIQQIREKQSRQTETLVTILNILQGRSHN